MLACDFCMLITHFLICIHLGFMVLSGSVSKNMALRLWVPSGMLASSTYLMSSIELYWDPWFQIHGTRAHIITGRQIITIFLLPSLFSDKCKARGFTVIVDGRRSQWNTVKTVVLMLQVGTDKRRGSCCWQDTENQHSVPFRIKAQFTPTLQREVHILWLKRRCACQNSAVFKAAGSYTSSL